MESDGSSTGWELNASFWDQLMREGRDRYRSELTDSSLMQEIGPCEGLHILDAGCGEGYFSRKLAGLNAVVTGVDSSRLLIDAAKSSTEGGLNDHRLVFLRESMDNLSLASDTQDVVVCNHSLTSVPDPRPAIHEFARVLKPGGRLTLLMLHPCFYAAHIGRERESENNAIEYFSTRRFDHTVRVGGLSSPHPVSTWLYPLEYFFSEMRGAGFADFYLQEPHPALKKMRDDPWWRNAFTNPIFLMLTARRV